MSMFPDHSRPYDLEYGTDQKAVFNFFNTVYAWMAVGLALTATVAWFCSQSPFMINLIYRNPFVYLAGGLVAFGIAMAVRTAATRMSPAAATGLFLLYAAVIGALISYVFVVYKLETLGAAFLITGGVFGGMSVYGFVTKRDLTAIGSIAIMCVWGLLLASVVNIFFASTAFSWFITYAVLAVFIVLTAYDTQKLRQIALDLQDNPSVLARYAIVGSLELYVDFINIFLSIVRILGSRR